VLYRFRSGSDDEIRMSFSMMILRPAVYGVETLTAAALLAACSGNGGAQPYAPSDAAAMGHRAPLMPNRKFPGFTGVNVPIMKPDHHKSWVSPDVKRAPRIVFVTDYAAGDVDIFSMPNLTLKGTLTGFSGPQGACSDGSNIWITNTNTSQIFKYSRSGTLLGTMNDNGEYPTGCSVNHATGDVVVSNIISASGGGGNLVLYKGGSGYPTPLTNPGQYEYFFPTFDDSGNIFADGYSNSFFFIVSECPAGSSTCHTINVSGASLFFPGGLNWDRVNNQLVIGDQECGGSLTSCWYAATVSGSTATVTGTTMFSNFDGTACDIDQGALGPFSRYAAGGCITYGTSVSTVDRWLYPAGGTPTNYGTDPSEPIGTAISSK
jgi:hypothetical protein